MVSCPYCNKEINDLDYMMIAFDKPYLNVRFHRACLVLIPDVNKYIIDNLDRIMKENGNKLSKITKK